MVVPPFLLATNAITGSDNPLLWKDPNTGFRPAGFYYRCMVGGFFACGFTHAAVVTLDVAKVRSQAHSVSGKWPGSLVASIKKGYALEGWGTLVKGWVPTFWGYGAQGLFKFGLNEWFKDLYTKMVGDEVLEKSTAARMTLWAAASGSAEVFADVALCPFEMTKVRMQVALPLEKGVTAKPNELRLSNSMFSAMKEMSARSAETKFPFGSLYPLWGRQVPYTMIKFVGFYQTQEFVYDEIERRTGRSKADISSSTQLGITFACGYWAGIFCAIATQPMDNLVSMAGNEANKGKSWGNMAKEMGIRNLFVKGLTTRIIMIGTLTGLQWWIYGYAKNLMGFGTS